MSRKIVIFGGYGNANTGDEAFLFTILRDLAEKNSSAEFTIFSDNPVHTRTLHQNLKVIYTGRFGLFDPSVPFLAKLNWIGKSILAIAESDLFIVGAGTILQDYSHPLFIPFWLSKVSIAKIFKRKVMFYGIGAGPIKTKLGQFLVKTLVNQVDLITVRGKTSKDELVKAGVNPQLIKITADPAVSLSPCSPERVEKILTDENISLETSLKFGFCLRHWFKTHRFSLTKKTWNPEQKEKFQNIEIILTNMAEYLIEKYGAQIIFIPMSNQPPNDDRLTAKEIIDKMKHRDRARSIKGNYQPPEIQGILKHMDFILGMRLHSLILASSVYPPVVGTAYALKTKDYLQELGLEEFVIELENISFHRLKIIIDKCLENREEISDRLKKEMPLFLKRNQLNSQLAYDLLEGNS